jgi:hypothetical protein
MIIVLADERLKRATAKAQAALDVYDDYEEIRTKAIRQWIDNTPAWKAISYAAFRETSGMNYSRTKQANKRIE